MQILPLAGREMDYLLFSPYPLPIRSAGWAWRTFSREAYFPRRPVIVRFKNSQTQKS
jgi:hypothetical protein